MNEVAHAFMASSQHQLDHARNNINHCLDQLGTGDLWWTPRDGCNPIGVIIQHLLGNLRQWAISGIGGEPDVRDRPAEFRVEGRVEKGELQTQFNRLLDRVAAVYSNVGDSKSSMARESRASTPPYWMPSTTPCVTSSCTPAKCCTWPGCGSGRRIANPGARPPRNRAPDANCYDWPRSSRLR